MKGDYETGQILDLRKKREHTKKVKGRYTYASIISGLLAAEGALSLVGDPTIAGTVLTLTGVVVAAGCIHGANVKSDELQDIKLRMSQYRSALTNKGVEYGKTPEEKMLAESTAEEPAYLRKHR